MGMGQEKKKVDIWEQQNKESDGHGQAEQTRAKTGSR
jgi:hypothetical protein